MKKQSPFGKPLCNYRYLYLYLYIYICNLLCICICHFINQLLQNIAAMNSYVLNIIIQIHIHSFI